MLKKILAITFIFIFSLFTISCSNAEKEASRVAVDCYKSIYEGDMERALTDIYFPGDTTFDDYKDYRVTLIKVIQKQKEEADANGGIKTITALRALEGHKSDGYETLAVTIRVEFKNHVEKAFKVSVYNVNDKWLVRM